MVVLPPDTPRTLASATQLHDPSQEEHSMPHARVSRRKFLAGAVGASAALAVGGAAFGAPAVKKGTSLRLWILKTYVEPTNKAIEASTQRWAEKHGAAVTVEY